MKKCAKIMTVCLLAVILLSLTACTVCGSIGSCFSNCGGWVLEKLGACNSCFLRYCNVVYCTCLSSSSQGHTNDLVSDCDRSCVLKCYTEADECRGGNEEKTGIKNLMDTENALGYGSVYTIDYSFSFDEQFITYSREYLQVTMTLTFTVIGDIDFEDVTVRCRLYHVYETWQETSPASERYLPTVKSGKTYTVTPTFYFKNPGGYEYAHTPQEILPENVSVAFLGYRA